MKAEKKCVDFIRKTGMLVQGDRVVAGVSGGADSVFLFFVLLGLREKLSLRLTVLHVNHGIRGAEADRDERFVEELCRTHGVPCRSVRRDIPGEARRRGIGEEEAGRDARHTLLAGAAEEEGGARIALAHHKNDLAETVLFRMARGTGIRGLASMRPVSGNVIRPLLCLTREEITASLRGRGIPWCEDSTNRERNAARNRIRLDILPRISEEINAGAVEHLAALAFQAAEADDFLAAEAARRGALHGAEGPDGIRVRDSILEEMPAMRSGILRLFLGRLAPLRDMGRVHTEDILKLYFLAEGARMSLPHGLAAVRERGAVLLAAGTAAEVKASGELPAEAVPVRLPCGAVTGETVFGKWVLFASWQEPGSAPIPRKQYTKWLDYDKIKGNIVIRTRRTGDFLTIDGEGRRKSLSDYFTDEKVPRAERDRIPVIADGKEILWAAGMRIGAGYRVSPDTEHILELTLHVDEDRET